MIRFFSQFRMNLRRATIFGVVFAALFLSACQPVEITQTSTSSPDVTTTSTEKTTATEDPTPTETATATPQSPAHLVVNPEALNGLSIRFLHPWPGETAKALEEIATRFSLSNPWGIWVDVQPQGSELQLVDTLLLDIERGDQPALIAVHPYLLEGLEEEYTSVPVSDYYDSPDWGMPEEVQEDIPAFLLEQYSAEDGLTALPVAPRASVIFYNQSWAEELGFSSPPETERDFRQQTCEATFANLDDANIDNDGTGGWLVNPAPEVLASWYSAFDGELLKDGQLTFDNEVSRDAFRYLKGVYDEGCIWIGRQSEPYDYFTDRYALMYAGTLDQTTTQKGWMATAESEDDWLAIGYPGPDGQVILVDSPGLLISQDTPEKQMAAWLFARHLLEPDVQAELVQHLFTIPMRYSALDDLEGFGREHPQWAQIADMTDVMNVLPASEQWGLTQWVLQDAFNRILHSEADQIPDILEELDRLAEELQGGEQ